MMYSTNLNDAQWQMLEKYLPDAKRKRKHSLREVFDALFYILKTGCQWRMLPKTFPKWELVYYYFAQWRDQEVIEHLMHMVREKVRVKKGKKAEPTVGIIDCQSVKTTRIGGIRGIDGNKKIKGRKRHVVVDTLGFILAVVVHAANLHETDTASLVMRKLKENFIRLRVIFADGGYRGQLIENVQETFNYVLKIVLRKDTEKKFKVLPKRWIIERTFSWFENNRRLGKDYEYLLETSETMIHLSALRLMLNKI